MMRTNYEIVVLAKLARTHALNTGTRREQQPPVEALAAFNISTTTNDNNCNKQIEVKYHPSTSIAEVPPAQTRNHIGKPKPKKETKTKENKKQTPIKNKTNNSQRFHYQFPTELVEEV